MTVAIIGCGLSGLCLAQGLKRRGVPFHLYDRDPSRQTRKQGYRITVDEHGLKALEACLPEKLFELAEATAGAPGGFFRFLRGDLREIYGMDFTPKAGATAKYLGRQIDRAVLREILFTGLEESASFGKVCTKVEVSADRSVVHCADGTSATADVVVGADGASSALRAATGQQEPEDLDTLAIYGRTRLDPAFIPKGLEKSGVVAIGPPGRAFFFTAIRFQQLPQDAFPRFGLDGSAVARQPYIMWALAISRPDARLKNWHNIPLAEIAQTLLTGFDPSLKQMVLEAEPEATLLLPLRASKAPVRWKSPSITLMGDAAHLMPPFGAHGGNTALRDAALLADCFSNHPTRAELQERLQRYQQEMLGYGFKQVKSAKGMMRLALGRTALLRFALLDVVPALLRGEKFGTF